MMELQEIVKAYDTDVQKGRRCALATVVHVNGSSYRRPGARMLVNDEGMITGAISGGCLEGNALQKALFAIAKQEPLVITYDTSDEEDRSIGVQLGCAGIIKVLFEPIHTAKANNPIELIKKALQNRQPSVLITFYNLNNPQNKLTGTYLITDILDNAAVYKLTPATIQTLQQDVDRCLATALAQFTQCHVNEATVQCFIEWVPPVTKLVIAGAGNDAIPLMQMAELLGWKVAIIDGRYTHAKQERFSASCQVTVTNAEAAFETITVDAFTVFVLLTHNYNYDKAILRWLLPLTTPYIGVLGPKKKLNHMLQDLKADGVEITDDAIEKVYGPIGLEIGAETPEEIAISIIAEILAALRKKPGGYLRTKATTIHQSTTNISVNDVV
jgi:xanthine/CO dehydrogenase XdhC/CoxF family maturation factor